jgi:hypothetical protein
VHVSTEPPEAFAAVGVPLGRREHGPSQRPLEIARRAAQRPRDSNPSLAAQNAMAQVCRRAGVLPRPGGSRKGSASSAV